MNWHITQSSYIISSPIHYFRKTKTIISQNPVTDNNVRKQVLYIAEIVTKLRKSPPPIVDSVRWVKIPGRYYRLPDTCTTTIAVITGICFCFFLYFNKTSVNCVLAMLLLALLCEIHFFSDEKYMHDSVVHAWRLWIVLILCSLLIHSPDGSTILLVVDYTN